MFARTQYFARRIFSYQIDSRPFRTLADNIIGNPVQLHEIESALTNLAERPELCQEFGQTLTGMDFQFPETENGEMDVIFAGAKILLSDPTLIAATAASINSKRRIENSSSNLLSDSPSDINFSRRSKLPYDELKNQYMCTICQDLTAAPVLTNCSHTFCGHCLQQQAYSCMSSDIEVVQNCSICRKEIKHYNLEKLLDENLQLLVNGISGDIERVEEWFYRRSQYFRTIQTEMPELDGTYDETLSEKIVISILVISAAAFMLICMSKGKKFR